MTCAGNIKPCMLIVDAPRVDTIKWNPFLICAGTQHVAPRPPAVFASLHDLFSFSPSRHRSHLHHALLHSCLNEHCNDRLVQRSEMLRL